MYHLSIFVKLAEMTIVPELSKCLFKAIRGDQTDERICI